MMYDDKKEMLLFSGQGSQSHMTDAWPLEFSRNDDSAEDNVETQEQQQQLSLAANKFLEQCLEAFNNELNLLSQDDQKTLGLDLGTRQDRFREPTSLFTLPADEDRASPVLESANFYVHQIVSLLRYHALRRDVPVSLVGGVCSGMLAAVVAATYNSSPPQSITPELLDGAVEGFRLALWVGIRNAQFCRRAQIEDDDDEDDDDDDEESEEEDRGKDSSSISSSRHPKKPNNSSGGVGGSWMLTVTGLSLSHLKEKVRAYNQQSPPPKLPVSIASILSPDVISVSGRPGDLTNFKQSMLPSSVPARFAHVHGYYHGEATSTTEALVSQILSDMDERSIRFPQWDDLRVPLLSTATGELADSGPGPENKNKSLVQCTLEHLFVDPVDCPRARERVVYCDSHHPQQQPGTTAPTTTTTTNTTVVLVGPNSAALRLGFRSPPESTSQSSSSSSVSFVTPDSLQAEEESQDSIAIVGVSMNFPSGNGPEEFWETLTQGRSTLSEIPPSRFDVNKYYQDATTKAKDKTPRSMAVRQGNFLDDPFAFDNAFFNISPREARSLDPQQRLLLRGSLEALEDSGYSPDSTPTFSRDHFGVYVGVATGDYVDNLRQSPDVYYSPGTLRAFLSGRISYAFAFHGPSIVVDTACSSSIVAIHQACNALKAGECRAALAGAVNVISSPDMYIGLARAHFLSQTGQCKPWDKGADGYSRAEGCGVVVLKRLSDALAEGDRIHGVIRATRVNQCGTAKSITHPDHDTQADLMRGLLRDTPGIVADDISYVEAHGTGTQAGDYAESRSVGAVFGGGGGGASTGAGGASQDKEGNQSTSSSSSSPSPLVLGSVKGNIGHAEAASGMAGLSKLLLMLRHGQIAPQASLGDLNPRLAFLGPEHISRHRGIVIPRALEPWKMIQNPSPSAAITKKKRRALLNNFGAAGSNAALILEEAPIIGKQQQQRQSRGGRRDGPAPPRPRRSCHLLNLSAKTRPALEQLRQEFCALLRQAVLPQTGGENEGEEEAEAFFIESVCYAANARREAYPQFRISVTGSSRADLADKLEKVEQPSSGDHESSSSTQTTATAPIAFVFSGQGGIFPGMGRELAETCPTFREEVERLDRTLEDNEFWPTMPYLLAAAAQNENQGGGQEEKRVQQPETGEEQRIVLEQCACFALEHALARTWISWGVTPAVVTGHSLGEYAAFATAGILAPEEAVLLVARRARLMARLCEPEKTGMLACRFPAERARQLVLSEWGKDRADVVTVACENSPGDTVLAGPRDALARLADRAKKESEAGGEDLKVTPLRVPFGYHSPAMDPILDEFRRVLLQDDNNSDSKLGRRQGFRAPTIPLISSYLGTVIRTAEDLPSDDYFVNQARNPVRFVAVAEALAAFFSTTQGQAGGLSFLEVGPSPVTVPKLKWAFDDHAAAAEDPKKKPLFCGLLGGPKQPAWLSTSAALREMFLRRLPIRWREVYRRGIRDPGALDRLPRYPLRKDISFVVPFQEPEALETGRPTAGGKDAPAPAVRKVEVSSHVLVDTTTMARNDDGTVTVSVDTEALRPFIRAHQVGEVPLCPASVYVEGVLEGLEASSTATATGTATKKSEQCYDVISNILFENPLVEAEQLGKDGSFSQQEVILTLHKATSLRAAPGLGGSNSHTSRAFSIDSSARGKHCTGLVSASLGGADMQDTAALKGAYAARQKVALLATAAGGEGPERFSAKTVYDAIFPRVVRYADPLRTLDHLTIASSGLEGLGTFHIASNKSSQSSDGQGGEKKKMRHHPAFIDTLLHAPGFIANARADPASVCICAKVGSVVVPAATADPAALEGSLEVYCSLVDVGHSVVADAVVLHPKTGEALAWAEGMAFKKLPLSLFKAHLSRIARPAGGGMVKSHVPPPPSTSKKPAGGQPSLKPATTTMASSPLKKGKTTPSSSSSSSPSSPPPVSLLPRLHALVRETCGLDSKADLRPDVALVELGIDSLMVLELTEALEALVGAGGAGLSLDSCRSVGDLEAAVLGPVVVVADSDSASSDDDSSVSGGSSLLGENTTSDRYDQEEDDWPPRSTPGKMSVAPTPPNESVDNGAAAASHRLANILERALGLDMASVDRSAALSSLGCDSLGTMELAEELRDEFGVGDELLGGHDDNDGISGMTVGMLEKAIVSSFSGRGEVKPKSDDDDGGAARAATVTITTPTPTQLVMFHDGSGKGTMYSRLDVPGHDVEGISSVDFSSPDPGMRTVEDLARLYIERSRLASRASTSTLILGGWSFGGVLAFEVARQLEQQRRPVLGVVVIDSPYPIGHHGLPALVIDDLVAGLTLSKPSLKSMLAAQFKRHAAMLERYDPLPSSSSPSSSSRRGVGAVPVVQIRCTRPFDTTHLGVSYPWLSDPDSFRTHDASGWERLSGFEVPVLDLGCHHFEVFEASNVSQVSELVHLACTILHKGGLKRVVSEL